MENYQRAQSAPDRILGALKTRGPQTVAELATATGVCGEAVRQQLVRLSGEGFVAATSQPRGVGRPAQVWALTPAANAKFPDRHAEFVANLIRLIRTELGEAALNRLIEADAAERRVAYAAMLKGVRGLRNRLVRLAYIRTNEGYMAEVRPEGKHAFLFIENHCPIGVATTRCPVIYATELETFRVVLGPDVGVEPMEHFTDGDRRCAYRITTKVPADPAAR